MKSSKSKTAKKGGMEDHSPQLSVIEDAKTLDYNSNIDFMQELQSYNNGQDDTSSAYTNHDFLDTSFSTIDGGKSKRRPSMMSSR